MALQTETLSRLLDQKHECVRQLHELGLRQLESIGVWNFEQLMKILGGKQRLLAQLQEIERRLDPFHQQSPQERRWASEAERARCAELARRCQALLQEIVAQERESERQVTLRKADVASQLQSAHGADLARGAYSTCSPTAAGQLDLSSES